MTVGYDTTRAAEDHAAKSPVVPMEFTDEEVWAGVGSLCASTRRATVARSLRERSKTPTTVAGDTGMAIQHVSNYVCDMRERGLLELLSPEGQMHNRVYRLTQKGHAVLERFEEMGAGE